MNNISEMFTRGKESVILKRLQAFDLAKSAYKTAIIDAENEEYQTISSTLTGVEKLIESVNNRVVSASGLPHTILLGDSPSGGLSGKGESEKNDFYDFIASEQESILRPNLDSFFNILFNSKEFKSQANKDGDINFLPLQQQNEKEI